MNTDPWYSAYHYSHPPLVERLAALDESDKKADWRWQPVQHTSTVILTLRVAANCILVPKIFVGYKRNMLPRI